jgi:uncharacterized membrane protein YfcA
MTPITVVLALLIGTSLGLVGGGGLGAVGALAGARLGRLLPAAWLMAAFSMVVTAVVAALALVGTLVGVRTATRARPEVLRRVFGLLVLGVGVYTGAVAFV